VTKRELYWEVWNKWPICGCGNPEATAKLIHKLLLYTKSAATETQEIPYEYWEELVPDEGDLAGVHWLLMYLLDHLGYAEHGSSARFGWLTDKGKDVIAAIEKYGLAWLFDIANPGEPAEEE
jgi:hypothetical protein